MKYLKLFEQYIKYSDYELPHNKRYKAFGSPEKIKAEVQNYLSRNILPDSKFLKKLEDVSVEDKGIKFEATLKNGDKIHLYKTYLIQNIWEIYYNKKKITPSDLKKKLLEELLTPLEIFLKYAPSYDYYAAYIDDGKQWRAANANNDAILKRFNDLSNPEKKKAIMKLKKKVKNNHAQIDNTFKI